MGLAGRQRRTFRQLSGGEQRRLALALALVGRPQVAFLDEPTAAVDPEGRQVIRQIVADLRADGVAVLLTTHDLAEAERIADRIVIVHEGRLLAQGSVEDLTCQDGPGNELHFRAPPGLDTAALAEYLGGWDRTPVTEVSWGEYRVAAPASPDMIYALTSWLAYHELPLDDVRTHRRSLEEVGAPGVEPGPAVDRAHRSPARRPRPERGRAHAGVAGARGVGRGRRRPGRQRVPLGPRPLIVPPAACGPRPVRGSARAPGRDRAGRRWGRAR